MNTTPSASNPAPHVAPTIAWDQFPGYLIDHCEGTVITEEGLQQAIASMLKDPAYAPKAMVVQDARTEALGILRQMALSIQEGVDSAELEADVLRAMELLSSNVKEQPPMLDAATGLAACPFCDGEAELAQGYHSMVDAKVVCKTCGGEGPLCNEEGKTQEENSADAIASWNRMTMRPDAEPVSPSQELVLHEDLVREGFEQSRFCYGERPADRIVNWQVWQDAVQFAVRTLDENNPSLQAQLEVWYPVVDEITLPPLEEPVLAAAVDESVQIALGSTVRMLQEAAQRDKEGCFYTHWRRLPSAPTVLLRAIKRLTQAPENQPSEG